MKDTKNMSNEERLKYLEEQHEKISTNQENKLLIDFDEAYKEELDDSYFEIKINNKIFQIPSEMPFNFNTFFLRHCLKKVKGKNIVIIPDDKIMTFYELMFGNELVEDLEANNNKYSSNFIMTKIVPVILKQWGLDTDASQEKIDELQKKMRNQKQTLK